MLAKLSSCRGVAARSSSVVQRQLQAYQPARVLHGGGSLRVSLPVCCVAANPGSSDEETPKWAKLLFAEVQKATAEAQKATAEAKKTQDMVGVVLEVAVRNVFSAMRVQGGGTILESMDDMLHFLLRCPIHLTVSQDPEFYRAVRAAITESLRYKDTGFLNAVIVLLRNEGMEQEAGQVEAVLRNGTGMEAAPEGVHTVRRCLQAVQEGAKAKGLGYDVGQLLSYAGASSTQERAALLETTLFVRCTAAMLSSSYTGVLEVDAGAGVGCEVDEAAGALRLRVGEIKYNPEGMEDAKKQLQELFRVVAYTLDKALAAADAAPAESKGQAALKQLPRCFIMDGVCVYAGKPSKQQLQRAEVNRRTVADASVIGEGGLQSAVLQVTFRSARYGRL